MNTSTYTLFTAAAVALLLTSCTQETYCPECEPVADVVIDAGPSVFEDFEQNTEYNLSVYCEGEAPALLKITFEEDGTCVVCSIPTQGDFGWCALYDYTVEDGWIQVYHQGNHLMSLTNSSAGLLTGHNVQTGCPVVVS